MANRSCLYACSEVPTRDSEVKVSLTGVSEYNWDIPMGFKLLMTGNPRPCPSSIWSLDDDIAVIADLEPGVEALRRFLAKVDNKKTRGLIEASLDYLEGLRESAQFFVLEAGEILELDDTDFKEQIETLIADIKGIEQSPEYDAAIRLVKKGPPLSQRILARLLKLRIPKEPSDMLYKLGIGYWSDVLYFDPNAEDDMPDAPDQLAEDEIPGPVAEVLAAYKAAFDAGDVAQIESLVHWGDTPEERQKILLDYGLSGREAGNYTMEQFEVYPYSEEYHTDYAWTVCPEWIVEYSAKTSNGSIVATAGAATIEGRCRLLAPDEA